MHQINQLLHTLSPSSVLVSNYLLCPNFLKTTGWLV